MARSKDSSDRVADAVIGACQDAVDSDIVANRKLAQTAFEESKSVKEKVYFEGQRAADKDGKNSIHFDTEKGWIFDTYDDNQRRLQIYQRLALFRVIQARTGYCAIP